MAACCCSLAGTAACQHCRNNPMATDVWTNKTVTVDPVEAKPFGKPVTNADRIRAMTDEELAETMLDCFVAFYEVEWTKKDILDWLKQEAEP